MKTYEIWSEGFIANGITLDATYLGTSEGNTFQEACENFAKKDEEFARCFDLDDLTYWGCRLFDNETEAREFCG